MPEAFWKGVISFGMVAIPVKMTVAIEGKTPSFHYLHKKCLNRPKQVLFCPEDNMYFDASDTVRGYEYAKNQFVVFDEDDFNKVPVRTTHSIDIIGFAKAEEIDAIYYSGCHYLEPEKLGVKPFALLRTVLEKTGVVGIAKVVFQKREHLCCLRPMGKIMTLHNLHYQQDILPADKLSPPEPKLSTAELAMATKLVESMLTGFKPADYTDEYALAINAMAEAKIKGVEIKAPPLPRVEIEDLMTALKTSVAMASKR